MGIIVSGFFIFYQNNSQSESFSNLSDISVVDSTNLEPEIMVTDGLKHIVPLDKIKSGGPPKDGIPSIDNPKFTNVNDSEFMSDSDIIIGLEVNGEAKAYPLFILVWHEIVNDEIGGLPVAVTYCPLCYTSQVFERVLDGKIVEFGTSGKLYNSNLLMYDRLTDSYWSQGLGTAVTGKFVGYDLKLVPFDLISWGDWKTLYPNTLVLTTDTGHLRSYATDPYGDYYTDPRIMFPVDNMNDRLHPKEIVLGFNDNKIQKVYKQKDIEKFKIINDRVGEKSLFLLSMFSGNSRMFDRALEDDILEFEFVDGKIFDTNTKSEWNYEGTAISGPLQDSQLERFPIETGFWFSWVSFYPDTLIYGESL